MSLKESLKWIGANESDENKSKCEKLIPKLSKNGTRYTFDIHNMRNMGAYKCKKIVFMLINVPAAEQIYHHVCPKKGEEEKWEQEGWSKNEFKQHWIHM